MTVTINKMSAGNGYVYFLRTVAVGDGDRSLSTPLTRYYKEEGTPPGRWMGSGLPGLESQIQARDEVTEDQLRRLIGGGKHPATGEHLGRRYRVFKKPVEGKHRHAVAGYDLTFSIPKSASVLWGVSDAGTQAIIADAHQTAVAEALDFLEREVLATRAGAKGPKGGVAQLEATGVIATAFDHYDSRANDPHLVETAGALDLSLSQAEPAARAATVQMVGDGGSVDAVRLGQRDDALSGLMPGDQFVDLCGRQEGLSRPDLTHHDAVGPGRSHLAPVSGAGERPPPHARFHGFHGLRRVREASHHVPDAGFGSHVRLIPATRSLGCSLTGQGVAAGLGF